jgi:isoquinoline 1-oxidoreductase subunit beta
MSTALSRSEFIRLTSSGFVGFVLAVGIDGCAKVSAPGSMPAGAAWSPSAWLRISPDNTVTVVLAKSEMGQGVSTGLPTLIAEELDFPLEQMKIEFAPAEARYAYPGSHGVLGTGGSTSMRTSWLLLRNAGATARAMLVAAAAKQWNVDASTLHTSNGSVIDSVNSRQLLYGSLASAAADLPVPGQVGLKPKSQWTVIGKASTPRLDIPAKVNGSATFGMDTKVPGMKYAALAMSPTFGGKVRNFNASKAKAQPGVIDVVQVPQGVAVIASNTWAAFAGKQALSVTWDSGPNASLESATMFEESERLARDPSAGVIATKRGDVESVVGHALEAIYRGPYLAHATMEPMNATADVRGDSCEVWVGTQSPTIAQAAAAQYSGLSPERCKVHTTYLGGGFGRRSYPDPVAAAVSISKAIKSPVKLVYTREDDVQHDYYRPMSVNAIRGVLDSSGRLTALSQTVVSESVLSWFPLHLGGSGYDRISMEGAAEPVYDIPNFTARYVQSTYRIPVGFWRAPDANWNIFVLESFVDELAHAAGKDPVAFRLGMLSSDKRSANVLRIVAQRSQWASSPGSGVFRGVAVGPWNGSFSAIVAEVSMNQGVPRVRRVFAVVDCGQVVNPDIVTAQVESAVNYGLSAALTGKITIKDGSVEQGNFDSYTVLHMAEAPAIDVLAVDSDEAPTGIGELGVPGIAPAVANAVFAATGNRARSLPLSDALG